MEYENVIRKMVEKCALEGAKKASGCSLMGVLMPMYLYYKESTAQEHGELKLMNELDMPVPAEFILACKEALQLDVPYTSYFCWVKSRVGRLPVLCNKLLCAV
ncbi:hypothetical protein [Rhodoferax antarcticus]|uniref:Uncharacterized protein n=1 Tax=Rhodoferax antarcticus ANT.BR TaxID=1111071 RepID=A0A1Q8Y9M1_9BURK|nr:hypothetical protein [Rhodoferax antarcticus]OLP04570.1 hypothetical protein BLL52_4099 [Rhodoferax antarcticus ANT.BR]